MAAAMRGYMAYRRARASTARPWAHTDSEPPSPYNEPIGGHSLGPGAHWYMYGFDERFLKHVVYYHFAARGEVHTWTPSVPPSRLDPEGRCDLAHVQARRNTTVCPATAVRLAPLRLGPDAVRIAFRLDEYRWLFDHLLRLVLEHADPGHCGGLFFHNLSDPYGIDLVPKQVNLFAAARRATTAVEIGFNAGHGAAIMLLANPRLTVRAFDLCALASVRPCLDYLNAVFGNRITLVEGRSPDTVGRDRVGGYDLAHIDADHTYAAVTADLAAVLPKCVPGAVIVMDDHEGTNDVARAARDRPDLVPTDEFTLAVPRPGGSHALFRYALPVD
jgi:hypothetical protein